MLGCNLHSVPRRLSTIHYSRHRPEQTLLHEVIREHLEGFITGSRERAAPVARFVERELRAYLECGLLVRRNRPASPHGRGSSPRINLVWKEIAAIRAIHTPLPLPTLLGVTIGGVW